MAMDFTECLTLGKEFTSSSRFDQIEFERDEAVYGLFPEFKAYVTKSAARDGVSKMNRVCEVEVDRIVDSVPRQWGFSAAVGQRVKAFLLARSHFLSQTLVQSLMILAARPQPLPFPEKEE
ncbi:MAG: hypothetical protein HY719_12725 [Planctomycetes bacterium]|nr:hypothetical protein [Planctomycetota bacterium]